MVRPLGLVFLYVLNEKLNNKWTPNGNHDFSKSYFNDYGVKCPSDMTRNSPNQHGVSVTRLRLRPIVLKPTDPQGCLNWSCLLAVVFLFFFFSAISILTRPRPSAHHQLSYRNEKIQSHRAISLWRGDCWGSCTGPAKPTVNFACPQPATDLLSLESYPRSPRCSTN